MEAYYHDNWFHSKDLKYEDNGNALMKFDIRTKLHRLFSGFLLFDLILHNKIC